MKSRDKLKTEPFPTRPSKGEQFVQSIQTSFENIFISNVQIILKTLIDLKQPDILEILHSLLEHSKERCHVYRTNI